MALSALVLSSWIAYGLGGPEVRVITTPQTACHDLHLTVDDHPAPLELRADPGAGFDIRVCSAPLKPGVTRIEVESQRLNAPTPRPNRIVILGDSGCRLKGAFVQECNDPVKWPFATIAERAAQTKPDLVIHVGDYHYRETPCPEGNKGCMGSPWSDRWETWDADFFTPARPLLEAAPWIMVRGNHEDCKRAGHGWTLTLDPDPVESACNKGFKPYTVDLDGLTLFVADDNDADDFLTNIEAANRLQHDFTKMPDDRPVWILTHHPWHGVVKGLMGLAEGPNATLDSIEDKVLKPNVEVLIAGHIHVLQNANFTGDHPAQLVTGISGDLLDQGTPEDLAGYKIGGWTIHDGQSMATFGYGVFDRVTQVGGDAWRFTAYKTDGTVIEQCTILHKTVSCLKQ